MCGIGGIMTADGSAPPEAALDALAEALAHRGPDGEGRHVLDGVGLVQTRLAIIDLVTGDQPIHAAAPDGRRATIVANGEFYNYVELAAGLDDAPLSTRSDCEPPLHLYLHDRLAFTRRLRGMYALAIHDAAAGTLVLARDPFGIKPLYYAESAAGFAFASEPQALVRAGLARPELRTDGRDEMLQLQFTTGRTTCLAGVFRVLPGETVVVERGRVTSRHRDPALPNGGTEALTPDLAVMHLDSLLNESVGLHQRSDVPYAMFLSGGIDSSVLLAMMARLNQQPVLAFTAGFPDTDAHDERAHARAVAAAVGADHVELAVTENDFWRHLPAIAAAMDDPAADYAVVPTWMLAREVRRAGLKVVLSGEGGDEIFAGYGRYRAARRWWVFGGRKMRAHGMFHGLGVLRDEDSPRWRDGYAAVAAEEDRPGRSALQVAQALDCADWLPNDLLTKLDRCLMAHGVEGRVPFLDLPLAAFGFRLPDRLKVRGRLGKWLLRRWLETGLPAAKPFARKRGFTVPVGTWIAARGRALGPLVAAQPGVAEACRPGTVERLFTAGGRHHAKAAWTLLFYALWHRRHMLGRTADADVFSALRES